MPFSIASLEDATSARVGVAECINHDMLNMYPVLTEKVGDIVAQFKATIVLLPSGALVLNETPFEAGLYETTFKVENKAILELLASTLDRKKAKKDKKAAAKQAAPAPALAPAPAAAPTAAVPAPAAVAEAKKEVKK